jgi:salicylate hydroxylase
MILFELGANEEEKTVHRAAFLRELLKPIPRDAMHVQKRLIEVVNSDDGGVLLHFSDGSQEYADMLVGADGIHSFVREHILGADHPATKSKFAGFWDCRSLVPFDHAVKSLGDEYFKVDRQYGWISDGGFMMHDVLDNGRTVQCVGSSLTEDEWHPNDWKRSLDRNKLEDIFASWKDGPITKGMIDVSH